MQDLIGFVLPPFIDIINQKVANQALADKLKVSLEKLRFWTSFIVAFIVAVVINAGAISTGDSGELLGSIGIIFAEAQIVYRTYWKEADLRTSLQRRID